MTPYSSPAAAYLDIETSWAGHVTVVGVYRPTLDTFQLVRPRIDRFELLDALDGAETLYTYNGSRFDLPVLKRRLGIVLDRFAHVDLMLTCWKKGLKGGLKRVEQALGIDRGSAGIDGIEAMRLWERFEGSGDADALETLLRYNRDDIQNLETLALKLERLEDA